MRREARKYLYDIQRAAGLLREFVGGKTNLFEVISRIQQHEGVQLEVTAVR